MPHILFLFLLASCASPAQADSFWNHNGSIMRLVASGNERHFFYHKPRPGMLAVGAQRDTLLFSGTMEADYYKGRAYAYSNECPTPTIYRVEGPVLRHAGKIRLRLLGKRPILKDCNPSGDYLEDRLIFSYIGLQADE